MGRPAEEPHHVTARPASYKYTTSPQNQERGPFTRTLTIHCISSINEDCGKILLFLFF